MLLLQAQQVLRLPLPLPSLHIPHQLSHPTTILPHLRYLASLNRLNLFILREVKLQHLPYIFDIRSALLFHLQTYPNLSQPPPAFSGQYSNSGQFTSAGSSGYGQYQSAPAHPPGHVAGGHPPAGHSQYQAQPYAGQASAVGGYQVRSGGVLNCLTNPPLISGNESISNRRLPAAATRFNWRSCSYCTRIPSTV